MKHYILLAIGAFSISMAGAQFSKGDKYITGSVNAAWQTLGNSTAKQHTGLVNFSPSLSWFKTDKKATGFKLVAVYLDAKQTSGPVTQNAILYNLGFSIFAKHFFPVANRFYVAVEKGFSATYVFGKTSYSSTTPVTPAPTKNKGYNVFVYLSPEAGCKLTDRLTLGINFSNILQLGFQEIHDDTSPGKETTLYLNSSLGNQSVGQLGVSFGWRLK